MTLAIFLSSRCHPYYFQQCGFPATAVLRMVTACLLFQREHAQRARALPRHNRVVGCSPSTPTSGSLSLFLDPPTSPPVRCVPRAGALSYYTRAEARLFVCDTAKKRTGLGASPKARGDGFPMPEGGNNSPLRICFLPEEGGSSLESRLPPLGRTLSGALAGDSYGRSPRARQEGGRARAS